MKEIDFKWTDAEVKKILHAATGNIKDFVMNEDGFLADFKASHTTVVKGDWQIESFIGPHRNIWERDFIGSYGYYDKGIRKTCKSTSQWMLSVLDKGFSIHSVRRLSDNEVFSVGDEVGSKHKSKAKINSFNIVNGEMKVEFIEDYCDLYWLSKPLQRTPLFKTECGKDVFLGDKNYLVDTDLWIVIEDIAANITNPDYWDSRKAFSTESAANEYVMLNKPCLSVSDVLSICDTTFEFAKLHTGRLKELSKQRLNKQ